MLGVVPPVSSGAIVISTTHSADPTRSSRAGRLEKQALGAWLQEGVESGHIFGVETSEHCSSEGEIYSPSDNCSKVPVY